MNWILIMWILGTSIHTSPAISIAEFSSSEACENAGKVFVQKANGHSHFGTYGAFYTCAPKNTLAPLK